MRRSWISIAAIFMMTVVFFQNCGERIVTSLDTQRSSDGRIQVSIMNPNGDFALPAEVDLDTQGSLKVYLRNETVAEGEVAQVRIVLNRSSDAPVEISLRTFDGSARSEMHYAPLITSLTFPPGETEVVVDISTLVYRLSTTESIFGVQIFDSSVEVGQIVSGVEIQGDHSPLQLSSLSIHDEFACGLDAHGGAWCWGSNTEGQLGLESVESSFVPSKIQSASAYTEVKVGHGHACARTADGGLECWGGNQYGQLGVGDTEPSIFPLEIPGLSGVEDFDVGFSNTCAVNTDSQVFCWGSNEDGQMGTGEGSGEVVTLPTEVSGNLRAVSIAVGKNHICAHLENGMVSCWGSNAVGQLGRSSTVGILPPQQLGQIGAVKKVKVASGLTCVLDDSEKFICWGRNNFGRLGQPLETLSSSEGFEISRLKGAVDFDLGEEHNCARILDGTIQCWGNNRDHQLGRRTQAPYDPQPRPVEGFVRNAAYAEVGNSFSCYLDTKGEVRCWGGSFDGRLGNSAFTVSQRPLTVPIEGLNTIRRSLHHSCGITTLKQGQCWGLGDDGELGLGVGRTSASQLSDVIGLSGVRDIQLGWQHSCAHMADETVSCWGDNSAGSLGNGSEDDTFAPIRVSGVGPVRKLAVRAQTNCVIQKGGANVSCWGGWIGNEGRPVSIPNLRGIQRIAVGETHACAIHKDYRVSCWGSNDQFQLGRDDTENTNLEPVEVPNINKAYEIAAGRHHTCVLRENGVISCWGSNRYGQLGLENMSENSIAGGNVTGIQGAKQISAGGDHSCVITSANGALCWGRNNIGQLGNDTLVSSGRPQDVVALGDVIGIEPFRNGTYFRRRDGRFRVAGKISGWVSAPQEQPISVSAANLQGRTAQSSRSVASIMPSPLNVEAEKENVSIFDNILFTLKSIFSRVFNFLFGS